MKYHEHVTFVPSDTVEVFVDGAGHAPRPMPKVDAQNTAVVLSSTVATSVHFGGGITDPHSKGGTLHLAAGATVLLSGADAESAAVAERVFALAPSGGTLKIQRGSAKTEMVFHD